MIKNFKTFQLLTESSTASNLADQFDYDYVEEYYDKQYGDDIRDVIEMVSHENIMNFFNGDEYLKDWVRDYISDYEFSEFDEDDLKSYIKENIDDAKETKILEIYNNNNYDEDDENSEKETEYDEYMVDELDKDELQEVIYDEYNCTEWIINSWYEGQDGEDLFDEMCGLSKKNNRFSGYEYGNYKYGSFEPISSSELYKRVSNYIDDEKLIQDFKNNTSFDTKKESIENDISFKPELQRYLLKKDPNNVDELITLWKEENSSENIGGEYKFQKAYINKQLKDNMDENDDEEYKEKLIVDALEFLYNEFGINDKIAKKYEPYMWKIEAQHKYNL